MMRDPLAAKVFQRMGVPASHQVHVRLFINDTFAGVYVVVEPVNRRFIRRVFGEREADEESGGYLYEYRWLDEYDFSYSGPDLSRYAAMFRAQTRDTESSSNLYGPLRGAGPRDQRHATRAVRGGSRPVAGPPTGRA